MKRHRVFKWMSILFTALWCLDLCLAASYKEHIANIHLILTYCPWETLCFSKVMQEVYCRFFSNLLWCEKGWLFPWPARFSYLSDRMPSNWFITIRQILLLKNYDLLLLLLEVIFLGIDFSRSMLQIISFIYLFILFYFEILIYCYS